MRRHLFVTGDRVLLVHRSTSTNGWDIPGTLVGGGESPAVAASRELSEDLGLDLFVRHLLVVDWTSGAGRDELLHVFDGGRVRDVEVRPALSRYGLDRWAWVPVDQLTGYVPDDVARRLARAHKARAEGGRCTWSTARPPDKPVLACAGPSKGVATLPACCERTGCPRTRRWSSAPTVVRRSSVNCRRSRCSRSPPWSPRWVSW